MDLTSNGPPASYIFPILRSQDIVECISELEIELSSQELTEPSRHKEKLRTIWLRLIEHCTGKNEQALQAPEAIKEEAETLSYPMLHQDFGDIFLFRTLRTLLATAGYGSFGWRDLYAPSPKRLRVQLSALLNLAKFREEQLGFFTELNEPRQLFFDTITELNQENEVLHDQLTQTETSSQTKNSEIQGIAKECQDLEVEIARSNKLQAAAREEANALKRRANDLKDELATAVWALQETEAEEEQLRGQIISSPDRRTADVAKARDELDAVKAEAARFEEETELGKTSYRNLNKALKDVTSVMTNLDDLQKEYDRRTDLNRKLEETFKTVAVKKNEHKDLLEETQQADRDVSRTEEKISAQRKQHQVQIEALQDALETAKSQLLHVEKERREGMLRIQEWEAEVKRLEGAIEKERLETKQEMDRMTAEYKEYERGFLDMDRRRQELLAANSPLQ